MVAAELLPHHLHPGLEEVQGHPETGDSAPDAREEAAARLRTLSALGFRPEQWAPSRVRLLAPPTVKMMDRFPQPFRHADLLGQ